MKALNQLFKRNSEKDLKEAKEALKSLKINSEAYKDLLVEVMNVKNAKERALEKLEASEEFNEETRVTYRKSMKSEALKPFNDALSELSDQKQILRDNIAIDRETIALAKLTIQLA